MIQGSVRLCNVTDRVLQLPWEIKLTCGTVCDDTEHPDGQEIEIPWHRDIMYGGTTYKCRYKPVNGTPCPSANDQDTKGVQEKTDLQQPVESAFSGIPS